MKKKLKSFVKLIKIYKSIQYFINLLLSLFILFLYVYSIINKLKPFNILLLLNLLDFIKNVFYFFIS